MKHVGLILIVVLVVAGILIVPSLYNFGSSWYNKLKNWVEGTGSGTASVDLIFTYEDGTTRTVSSKNTPIMSVLDNGKALTSIVYKIFVKMEYAGNLTSCSLKGLDRVRVLKGTEDLGDIVNQRFDEQSYTSWKSGTEREIETWTITASTLENFLSAHNESTSGDYLKTFSLEWIPSIEMTATFKEGMTYKKTANAGSQPIASWSFQYERPHIKSLNIVARWTTFQ
jgi:hypothetical protein